MKKWLDNSTFIDNHGYLRDKHNRLIHRQIAFQQIFRPNRNKYSRPFSDYNVHHIDGNKLNNDIKNLEIILPNQHRDLHRIDKIHAKKARWVWALLIIILIVGLSAIILFFVTRTSDNNPLDPNCSENTYDCIDFSTQAEAQNIYDTCISQGASDVHFLDGDGDGMACDLLP